MLSLVVRNCKVGDEDAIVFKKRRAEVDIHSLAEKLDKYAAKVDSVVPAVKQRLDNTLDLVATLADKRSTVRGAARLGEPLGTTLHDTVHTSATCHSRPATRVLAGTRAVWRVRVGVGAHGRGKQHAPTRACVHACLSSPAGLLLFARPGASTAAITRA